MAEFRRVIEIRILAPATVEVGAFVRGILCGRVLVAVVRDWAEREIDIGLSPTFALRGLSGA
jgi:hypothetical protein